MRFATWLEAGDIWYHGSRRPWDGVGGQQQGFGGIHLGTKRAALQRLENTPSQRVRGVPGGELLHKVRVRLQRPYNKPTDPMSEHDLFLLLNLNQYDRKLDRIKAKHDGIYYLNSVEDAGKVSVLVFDKSRIQLLGTEPKAI